MIDKNPVRVYTDGSCNHLYGCGAWAAVILYDGNEIVIKGEEYDTTHNRMELLAVIKFFEYLKKVKIQDRNISIYSDSQYVVRIVERKEKLKNRDFCSVKNITIPNADLLRILIVYIESFKPRFIKVKAHQKKSSERNYNRDVDKISRSIVRNTVKKQCSKDVP